MLGVWAKSDSSQSSYTIDPIVYHNDTLLYIVNFGKAKGWKIISGDKRTPCILALDHTGTFHIDKLAQGVATWLDDLANRIYALKTAEDTPSAGPDIELWENMEKFQRHLSGLKPLGIVDPGNMDSLIIVDPEPEDGYWELVNITSTTFTPVTIGPLLSTQWGQDSPWNTCVPYNENFTSRCVTGCVAVSGAQMLYFFHHNFGVPTNSYSTGSCTGYSTSNSKNYNFNFSNPNSTVWDNMALQREIETIYPELTYSITTGTNYVAILMGFVGNTIGMNYTVSGSTANTEDLGSLFSNYGISSSFGDYNSSIVESSITNGIPVIVRADATRTEHNFLGVPLYYTYSDGHSWIIDGRETQPITYTYTYEWYGTEGNNSPGIIRGTKTETSTSNNYYFLMNWGGSGSGNSGRYTYSGDWDVNNYNFQYNRKMLYGFSAN